MNESLSKCLPDFSLLKCFPFEEDFQEVGCNKLGDFSSAVTVKNSEETDVLVAWD